MCSSDTIQETAPEIPVGCLSTNDISVFSLNLASSEEEVRVEQSDVMEWVNHILDCSACMTRLQVAKMITRFNPAIKEEEVVEVDHDLLRRAARNE